MGFGDKIWLEAVHLNVGMFGLITINLTGTLCYRTSEKELALSSNLIL